MRLLTGVAVLALLAGPAAAQVSPTMGTTTQPMSGVHTIDVSELEDVEVMSIRGEELGEIENVVRGMDGKLYAVMEFGGFLDIGEQKRLVDLSRMYWRDDALVLPGVTEAELETLPEWQDGLAGFAEIADDFETQIGLYTADIGDNALEEPTSTGSIAID